MNEYRHYPALRLGRVGGIGIIGALLVIAGVGAYSLRDRVARTRAAEPVVPVAADPEAWGLPASATEVLAKRVKSAKHFRNTDGTSTAIFGQDIHYEASPGVWDDVDLTFRASGPDHIVEKNRLRSRVSSTGIEVEDPATGKGIRWKTPGGKPTVNGKKATFSDQGLTWEYETTPQGLKANATVSSRRGPQTYTFQYAHLGGSAEFTVDGGGNLVSDAFTVPRAFVIGADNLRYEASAWRDAAGPRVAFDFDDTALPDAAFPYIIDPTTTFQVAASGDMGEVYRYGPTYPPSGALLSGAGGQVRMYRTKGAPGDYTYYTWLGLARWDTSSIPDGETVTAATLRGMVIDRRSSDARSLSAEWYANTNWPISYPDDYTDTAGTDAHAGTLITSLTLSAWNDFALTNVTNISKTGYTGMRFHITGGEPTGENDVIFQHNAPQDLVKLIVTYTGSDPPIDALLLAGD